MSTILDTLSFLNMLSRWSWFFGCLCLPVCCVGMSCFVMQGTIISSCEIIISTVINIYGGKKICKALGRLVRIDHAIFCNAVGSVNAGCDARIINAKVTQIDVIAYKHPRIGKIFEEYKIVAGVSQPSPQTSEYYNRIWDQYTTNKGNYKIVVYGLVEYVFMMNSPRDIVFDDDRALSCAENFTKMNALNFECMSYKDEVMGLIDKL